MQNKYISNVSAQRPDTAEIRKQLTCILSKSDFVSSPKISAFLKYVVEETLAGRSGYIKAFSIALAVFDKDKTFDPQTDPIVRVQAVRLRKMLSQYYLDEGNSDPVLIKLHKGSYIPKFLYRIDSDRSEDPDSIIPTIAVLPFRYLGDSKNYEYFVDGISEEIVNKLSKFNEIQVIARQVMLPYKQKIIDSKTLGSKLHAHYFLRGSMRKAGMQIRLSVELVEAKTSITKWTKTFDRELSVDNIIIIQDDIADTVASTIAQPYGLLIGKKVRSSKTKKTNNLTAYEYFLRFYQYQLTLSQQDAHWACEGLEKAVQLDSNYSDAWAGLSIMYSDIYRTGYVDDANSQDVLEKAYDSANMAVTTGPDNALAYFSLYYVHATRHDKSAFIKAGKRAISLNPNNSIIVAQYGIELKNFGEEEEGLAFLEHAMELNPAHPGYYHLPLGFFHYYHGRLRKALEEAEKINAPEFYFTHILFLLIYHSLGEEDKKQHAITELKRIDPKFSQHARNAVERWIHVKDKTDRLLKDLQIAGVNIQ